MMLSAFWRGRRLGRERGDLGCFTLFFVPYNTFFVWCCESLHLRLSEEGDIIIFTRNFCFGWGMGLNTSHDLLFCL